MAAIIACGWCAAASAQIAALGTPPEVTVLKAAHLFDAVSGNLRKDAVVVIRGEKIVAVGGDAPLPAGARVIDLGDATLLPGFIDAHAHLAFEFDPDYYRHQFNLLMRFPAEQAHYAGRYAKRTLEPPPRFTQACSRTRCAWAFRSRSGPMRP